MAIHGDRRNLNATMPKVLILKHHWFCYVIRAWNYQWYYNIFIQKKDESLGKEASRGTLDDATNVNILGRVFSRHPRARDDCPSSGIFAHAHRVEIGTLSLGILESAIVRLRNFTSPEARSCWLLWRSHGRRREGESMNTSMKSSSSH